MECEKVNPSRQFCLYLNFLLESIITSCKKLEFEKCQCKYWLWLANLRKAWCWKWNFYNWIENLVFILLSLMTDWFIFTLKIGKLRDKFKPSKQKLRSLVNCEVYDQREPFKRHLKNEFCTFSQSEVKVFVYIALYETILSQWTATYASSCNNEN